MWYQAGVIIHIVIEIEQACSTQRFRIWNVGQKDIVDYWQSKFLCQEKRKLSLVGWCFVVLCELAGMIPSFVINKVVTRIVPKVSILWLENIFCSMMYDPDCGGSAWAVVLLFPTGLLVTMPTFPSVLHLWCARQPVNFLVPSCPSWFYHDNIIITLCIMKCCNKMKI